MNLIEQESKLVSKESYLELVNLVSLAARTCYNSEVSSDMAKEEGFIKNLIRRGHLSPLEFANISVMITTSRGTLAQLSRHRIISLCVQSQRYCNYSNKGKYKKGISFILPKDLDDGAKEKMTKFCKSSESLYNSFIKKGNLSPEIARSILPNCTATTLLMSANIREWRHIFEMRCSPYAQKEIRELMNGILDNFKITYPCFFEDLNY